MNKQFRGFFDMCNTPSDVCKTFDWFKAVILIKKHDIKNADAGLVEDWSWTSGPIFRNGNIAQKEYNYLYSNWATPVLEDLDTGSLYECWMPSGNTKWHENTYWPDSAVDYMDGNLIQKSIL